MPYMRLALAAATAALLTACDDGQTFDQKLAGNAAAYECPEGTVAFRIQLKDPNGNGVFCLREGVLKNPNKR